MKKILISCPVSNRDWILPYYLNHIYDIEYDKSMIDIYWIVNNCSKKDKTLDMLRDFKKKHKNKYNSITIEIYNSKIIFDKNFQDSRVKHIRDEKTYKWLAKLRNKILKKAISLNCDYLLSVDSDILVKPDILNRLLEHDKDIVSSLIYNGYLYKPKKTPKDYDPIKKAYKYPNIMKDIGFICPICRMENLYQNNTFINYTQKRQFCMKCKKQVETKHKLYTHIVNNRVKKPEKCPKGKLLRVDFTGACILISNEVCKKAKYDVNKTYGEDEPFCFSARDVGFELWCDVSVYSQHIMSKDLLEKFKNTLDKF